MLRLQRERCSRTVSPPPPLGREFRKLCFTPPLSFLPPLRLRANRFPDWAFRANSLRSEAFSRNKPLVFDFFNRFLHMRCFDFLPFFFLIPSLSPTSRLFLCPLPQTPFPYPLYASIIGSPSWFGPRHVFSFFPDFLAGPPPHLIVLQ